MQRLFAIRSRLTSPQTIATMLRVAEDYDKLAGRAVAFRRVNVNPRSRWPFRAAAWAVTREAATKPPTPTLSQDSKRVGESALGVLLIREVSLCKIVTS